MDTYDDYLTLCLSSFAEVFPALRASSCFRRSSRNLNSAGSLMVPLWRYPPMMRRAGSSSFMSSRMKRSGERRVGEEGRSRWAPDHLKKKKRDIEVGELNVKNYISSGC